MGVRPLNWLDIILAIFLLYGLIQGLRRGFLQTLAGLVGYGLGMLAGFLYYRQLGNMLFQQWKDSPAWLALLQKILPVPRELYALPAAKISTSTMQTAINQLVKDPAAKGQFEHLLAQLGQATQDPLVHNAAEAVYRMVGLALVEGIAFGLLFIGVIALVRLTVRMLGKLMDATPLGLINRLAGGAAGLAKSTLGLAIFLLVLAPMAPLVAQEKTGALAEFFKAVNSSMILNNLKQFLGGF